jgi:Putative peptidoglycan binding domain
MRSIKGSLVGLVLAGILAIVPTAAFAHGGGGGGGGHGGGGGGFGGGGHGGGFGGGGHFGGGGLGGGHFGGGGGHFVGGGGHFAGYAGHSFGDHSFAGAHFARHGDHFRDRDHFRHDGDFFFGGFYGYPYYGYDYYPYYGYDYPYYGDYDYNDGYYSDAQISPYRGAPSGQTVVAVQKELAKLGYYHGQIDGVVGPETRKAISWFQSVDKLSVTGQINDRTLKALQIKLVAQN